jgi:hypothetical protein
VGGAQPPELEEQAAPAVMGGGTQLTARPSWGYTAAPDPAVAVVAAVAAALPVESVLHGKVSSLAKAIKSPTLKRLAGWKFSLSGS